MAACGRWMGWESRGAPGTFYGPPRPMRWVCRETDRQTDQHVTGLYCDHASGDLTHHVTAHSYALQYTIYCLRSKSTAVQTKGHLRAFLRLNQFIVLVVFPLKGNKVLECSELWAVAMTTGRWTPRRVARPVLGVGLLQFLLKLDPVDQGFEVTHIVVQHHENFL